MDPSWCPGCDKLILPRRYVVPITPPQAAPAPPPAPAPEPAPAPPQHPASPPSPASSPQHPPPPPTPTTVPSSPEVHKKPRRFPAHVYAHGGGLVHGTGRVRPGGGIRRPPRVQQAPAQQPVQQAAPPHLQPLLPPQGLTRTPPKPVLTPPKRADDAPVAGNPTAQKLAMQPAPAARQTPIRTTRVVISQDPTPLYCSEECRKRDLKNSFIESETQGFAGASAARESVARYEIMRQAVEIEMLSRQLPTVLTEADPDAPEPCIPPVPPNSLVDAPPPLCRTMSLASPSALSSTTPSTRLSSASAPQLHVQLASDAGPVTPPAASNTPDAATIRAPKPRARPRLLRSASSGGHGYGCSSGSLAAWGSPTKAAVLPPKHTPLYAEYLSSASGSIDSHSSISTTASALFDDAVVIPDKPPSASPETCSTTPSRRGSGSSSDGKKKGKRVSFASDSKPDAPTTKEDWRKPRRNPLLDANPLRDAVSLSPKDRIKASSLPSDLLPAPANASTPTLSQSTPCLVVDTSPTHGPTPHGVAMWPEDEKRVTESARVHGELLRGYAKCFRPREGRSLVCGPLWRGSEADAQFQAVTRETALPSGRGAWTRRHERQPDSRREYWREFEEREAEARARKRVAERVEREQEEKVICELLNGQGMREEDQPQARRMMKMAYDGTPGPAEDRGLIYKFDRFLYKLPMPKPTMVEKKVHRFDEKTGMWIEEVISEAVVERKKLFNFSD